MGLWALAASIVCTFNTSAQVIDLADVVARTSPAVVGIMRFNHNRTVPSSLVGTGFIIHDGRHIITNAHVLRAHASSGKTKTSFFALTRDASAGDTIGAGRTKRHRLQLVDTAEAYDLALLTFKEKSISFPALKIVGAGKLSPAGRAVYSIGFPIGGVLGPFPAVSSGIVSAITPSLSPQMHSSQLDPAFIRAKRYPLYQLDMTAYPGQSGSPLMDARTGIVVGVVNATKLKKSKERVLSDPSGISYAITSAELRTFLLRNGITP